MKLYKQRHTYMGKVQDLWQGIQAYVQCAHVYVVTALREALCQAYTTWSKQAEIITRLSSTSMLNNKFLAKYTEWLFPVTTEYRRHNLLQST